MRIQMRLPRIFIKGHLLENVDFRKSYNASPCGSGWLKIVDDSGKTIFLSKNIQRENFEVVEP